MKTATETVSPIVHPGGTSREELLQLRAEACSAIIASLAALRRMAPNGRDYYPEPGRMELAVEQHRQRCKALTAVLDSIRAECRAIDVEGA